MRYTIRFEDRHTRELFSITQRLAEDVVMDPAAQKTEEAHQ